MRVKGPARAGALALFALVLVLAVGTGSASAGLPAGFQDTVVFSGLSAPTTVRFASDGRVFVGQKNGVVKEFEMVTASGSGRTCLRS